MEWIQVIQIDLVVPLDRQPCAVLKKISIGWLVLKLGRVFLNNARLRTGVQLSVRNTFGTCLNVQTSRHVFERASIFVLVNLGTRRVCRVARSSNVPCALARKNGNA